MAKKRFKPGLIPLIVMIAMLVVLLYLGMWQMNRSSEKQTLIDGYRSAPSLPAVNVDQLSGDWLKYQYRKIVLYGAYDGDHQILLENQVHNSQSGYMVLTPFRLQNGGGAVLVNRGWVGRAAGNVPVSIIDIDNEPRKISGLLNLPPQVGIKLGSLDAALPGWPKTVPYVDNEWLALQMAVDIKPWAVMLADDEVDGFVRQWQPSVRMGPQKHIGYAFQWFSLAVALIFIFVITSFKQKAEETDEQDPEDQE